jgi:xanthine dehydrogenase YagT iron-sulfur-binding subunit
MMSRGGFVASASVTALGLQVAGLPATAGTTTGEVASSRLPALLGPAPVAFSLDVNGTKHDLTVEPRVTLLDAVRDHLGLTGPKKGCDRGACGACTMLVNGRRVDSCLTLAIMHADDRIVTIEGIGTAESLHPLQAAFIKHDAFQCGYCTPGQIVSAAGLLSEKRALDRETVQAQMSGNLCRCGCYPHIVDAVLEVAAGP